MREPKPVLHDAFADTCNLLEDGKLPATVEDITRMVVGIVANKICNDHRYQRSHPGAKGDEPEVLTHLPDAEHAALLAERERAVHQALPQLPQPQQELLRDAYMDEIPTKELAEKHNVSEKAMWTRLSRARAMMRDILLSLLGKDPKD